VDVPVRGLNAIPEWIGFRNEEYACDDGAGYPQLAVEQLPVKKI